MGTPVVLVYLGLLHADEMADRGKPLESHDDWDQAVRQHGAGVLDPELWDRFRTVGGRAAIVTVIVSMAVDLRDGYPR